MYELYELLTSASLIELVTYVVTGLVVVGIFMVALRARRTVQRSDAVGAPLQAGEQKEIRLAVALLLLIPASVAGAYVLLVVALYLGLSEPVDGGYMLVGLLVALVLLVATWLSVARRLSRRFLDRHSAGSVVDHSEASHDDVPPVSTLKT